MRAESTPVALLVPGLPGMSGIGGLGVEVFLDILRQCERKTFGPVEKQCPQSFLPSVRQFRSRLRHFSRFELLPRFEDVSQLRPGLVGLELP